MASPSSWASTHILRTSTSYGNIRSSAGGMTTTSLGTGHATPREARKDRRKPSVSSLNIGSTTSVSAPHPPVPTLPPSTGARPEESYLAAKRRTHRQSYFDYYPERGVPRARGEKEDGDGVERDKEKPRTEAIGDELAHLTPQRLTRDDEEETEDDNYDTPSRSKIHKSLSVGASGLSVSPNSASAPGASRKGKGRDWFNKEGEQPEQEESIVFPPIRATHSAQRLKHSSSSSARTLGAPKTYPHPYGAFRDDVPALRFSYSTYSSSQTQADTPTPPQTPIETSSRSSFDPVQVVVAAPISGVEAMDALVDGMDGSDEDDMFNRLQIYSKKPAVLSHHPLYAPPLPTPPPGIVLGRTVPRVASRKESTGSEDEDGDYETRGRSFMPDGTVRAERHQHGRRTDSSSTVVSDMTGRRQHFSTPTESRFAPVPVPPPSIDEIIRKHITTPSHQPNGRPRNAVPSISEIIRRNTPPIKQAHARPSNDTGSCASSTYEHSTRHDSSEPEPEPLTPAEEAELVSRSSIDSVAAEVQQTLRAYKAPTSISVNSAASSDATQVQDDLPGYGHHSFSTTRSAGGCDQSIRSGSASISASTSNGTSGGRGSVGAPGSPLSAQNPELNFRALQTGGGQKKQSNQKDVIATYLRSARITTLLKLTRRPHASPEQPLTVSLSDLGSPTGFPLVVFLGLGCVRYVTGLYDEMAECLGLRLITIDRWGLGRTDVPPSSASRGVPEWSTVVDEVLDRLNINRCSIMAHSAGAPYALAFASKYPERVVGDICLLAPWVGGGAGGGYRWLKYVPNGILKTAQAAEWKIQAWMIGKPPKITYEGIGYNVNAPVSSDSCNADSRGADKYVHGREADEHGLFSAFSERTSNVTSLSYPHPYDLGRPASRRKSRSSGDTFSDYDDLRDFDGRFESRTTFEQMRRRSTVGSADGHAIAEQQQQPRRVTKKKSSKGFLRIWKGIPSGSFTQSPPMPSIETTLQQNQQSQQQSQQRSPTQQAQPSLVQQVKPQGRKLKSLKSIGSLRNKSTAHAPSQRPQTADKSPVLPQQDFDTSLKLGLGELDMFPRSSTPPAPNLGLDTKINFPCRSTYSADTPTADDRNSSFALPTPTGSSRPVYGRAGGRRSVSFTTTTSSYSILSRPPSYFSASQPYSSHTTMTSHTPASIIATPTRSGAKKTGESYEVALGNALIAASHSESARGTHPDLLQILNHEQRPWGFSYARYPHRVRVWFGDRDERIAAHAVRWMEGAMGPDRCKVSVVHGADHGLMYRTGVVVDVFEHVLSAWSDGRQWQHGREHGRGRERGVSSIYEMGADPFKSL
ncbi:hypothetical protein M0805_000438 [Coniferiporia weirii]|nr:hypothetical protein M0805_000438 [Coniferiporia weirii]